ncbi:MAG TPA: ribokinase [Candidatus Dormibacteraeota bacterium]|nr:ribokinase [Candidatus Dormibacteraeota bacterium]
MRRVLVAGSINIDVVARTERHPEAGETVHGTALDTLPGGKGANQAVAAARAGAATLMAGRVGGDDFGRRMRDGLAREGVDVERVRVEPSAATGTALVVVDNHGENRIVVVPGANAMVGPDDVAALAAGEGDLVLAQMEVPLAAVRAAIAMGRAAGAITVLNAAPAGALPDDVLAGVDVLLVNLRELAALSHAPIGDDAQVLHAAGLLRARCRRAVVVTLGARGALMVAGGTPLRIDGHAVPVVDTTGAGDCFAGAMAARLVAGDGLDPALRFATAAAALSVQRPGAGRSAPHAAEVEAFLRG